ncbi:alpha/beta hydrolase [Nocardioides sp.]|uniref:alpha/beta hydrolase n=1 Tax=Nocardioides sp. TaxID=35761 RepID=UPI002F3F8040
MRRAVAAITLVVVVLLVAGLALVATGGSSDNGAAGGPTPVTPFGGPPATRPPSPDLARFYGQQLDWSGCGDNECARLTVPLDYRKPDGPTIRLYVLKVPASGSRIGSLVVNPGGPGAAGSSYAAGRGTYFGDPLLEHFDIIGFDPRGTGQSSPVECLDDHDFNEYLSSDPDPTTPAEIEEFRRQRQRLARGCAAESGALAGHVSTVEAARDMDILRAALGDPRMNYLGASYGTELGATYAQLFPQRVGRFVLDGAVDPSLGTRAAALQQAAGFQRALDAYAANCVQSGVGCFLGRSVAEVQQTISSVLDRISHQPLPTSDGRELTAGNAFYGIAATLYNRSYWILLSSGLRSALGGDGSLLMKLADAYAERNADGTFQSNFLEAFYDISCVDDPYSIPYREVPSQLPAFEKASPVFGRVYAWGLTACDGFTPRTDEKTPVIHAPGAQPIVVVGTTRDPATPYRWAVALARQLDSGVLVSRNGDGHTGYHQGNACVDRAVEGYLVSGIVPKDRLSC